MGSESEIMAEEVIGILIVVPFQPSNQELERLWQSQRSCISAASRIIPVNRIPCYDSKWGDSLRKLDGVK
jgi:hypothetical protein